MKISSNIDDSKNSSTTRRRELWKILVKTQELLNKKCSRSKTKLTNLDNLYSRFGKTLKIALSSCYCWIVKFRNCSLEIFERKTCRKKIDAERVRKMLTNQSRLFFSGTKTLQVKKDNTKGEKHRLPVSFQASIDLNLHFFIFYTQSDRKTSEVWIFPVRNDQRRKTVSWVTTLGKRGKRNWKTINTEIERDVRNVKFVNSEK